MNENGGKDLEEDRKAFRRIFVSAVHEEVDRLRAERNHLLIPDDQNATPATAGLHHHSTPQLFIQLSGVSEVLMPRASVRVEPRSMLIIPAGIPHREKAHNDKDLGAFMNVVVSYHTQQRVFAHLGVRGEDGFACMHKSRREGFRIESEAPPPHAYLEHAVAWFRRHGDASPNVIRGLLIAHLSMLLHLAAGEEEPKTRDSFKVVICQQYIKKHLSDLHLGVRVLADHVQCTPDYLSHVFRKETGLALTDYINRSRVELAKNLLETTALNIEETADACGYRNASYFTRVFKKIVRKTPREYRTSVGRAYELGTRTYDLIG